MLNQRRVPYSWLAAAGALALGEAVGLIGGQWAPCWPLAAIASALVALIGFGRAWRGWGVTALALAGLALALHFELRRGELLQQAELQSGPFVAELEVTNEPRWRHNWVSFYSELDGVALEVIMPVVAGEAPRVGERWRVAGWLERRDRFDRRRRTVWVKGRGTFAERMGDLRLGEGYRLAARVRRRLAKALATGLDERRPATALHRAMLLGERTALPKSEREQFIAAGTMHVFAISGLHVGVVAVLIVVMLQLTLVPLRIAGVLMVPLLWGYVFLIGLPPSAVRAALMASCYFLAPALWQRANGLVAWSQAFFIVHVLDPGALASVGSLLSFAVMLAILAYDHWANAVSLSGWTRTLGYAFAIWAAGAPIAAVVFGRLTPGGMLANLIVVPLAAFAVASGFLGMAVSLFCPFLGSHLNNLAALVTDAMRGISAAVASVPGSNFETATWTWHQCATWYLVLIAGACCLWFLRCYCGRERRLL